ncbi:MAG TPA: 2-isopropylmalate synthase [Thermoplasmata archaeon]|nr:2-isopropylmalate synthase [Thermoplasmata archaeon]
MQLDYTSEYNRRAMSGVRLPKMVRIFDTTLRDGEQTPGVNLSTKEKIRIAKALDDLGVDTIEAGFPAVSKEETDAIKKISGLGLNAEICALARSNTKDIDVALSCNVDCIHVFIATSDIHLKYKLKIKREEALEKAKHAVQYAKDHGVIVEFSSEDATRTDIEFLKKMHHAVQEVGADRVDVPDTVGVIAPHAMKSLVSELKKVTKVPISVHCHNDVGLAVANSLAGIEGGATQIQATINGIGERAGNAALEEIVISLATLYHINTNVDTKKIYTTSKMISKITGVPVQPNKAIVGANAFTHESGIHVHGLVANPSTYEAINPKLVGKESSIAIGKHSGRHSIKEKLREYGLELDKAQLQKIMTDVERLVAGGKKLKEPEFLALAYDALGETMENPPIQLKEFTVLTGLNLTPTATVRVEIDGEMKRSSKMGIGPVDAAINVLRSTVSGNILLKDYNLDAITGGSDSLCEVMIKLQNKDNNLLAIGKSVGPDIVITSVNAAVEALNRLCAKGNVKRNVKESEKKVEVKKDG